MKMTNLETLRQEAQKAIRANMQSRKLKETGNVMENTYNFLTNFGDADADTTLFECQNVCLGLMALLTNPEISKQLPDRLKPIVGPRLLAMFEFFDCVYDPASRVAFDLYSTEYCENEKELQALIKRYRPQRDILNDLAGLSENMN